jgi:hypothetical protein
MVRTFGIRFEEGGFDEGEHQTQMVSFLGTGHTELQASNEKIGAALADVLWHCEKPLLRTGPVPLLCFPMPCTGKALILLDLKTGSSGPGQRQKAMPYSKSKSA